MATDGVKGDRRVLAPTTQKQQLVPQSVTGVLLFIVAMLGLILYHTLQQSDPPAAVPQLRLPHGSSSAATIQQGCIVIVHLGSGEPIAGIPVQQGAQILDNIEQLRLFNPGLPVHLVVSEGLQLTASQVSRLQRAKATLSIADNLAATPEHMRWQQESAVAKNTDRNNFWRYASERFFHLSDVAQQHNLTNIIHIEYDNLIYTDVSTLIPLLRQHYQVGAVFDNPDRCIPGFMYFRTANDVLELAQFISQQAGRGMNDMQAIAQYRKQHPERILPLPLFDPATYPDPVDPVFATHLRELECVFDGAAYGQYIGGVDPRNIAGNSTGFVNGECLVKPDKMNFTWHKEKDLWVPFVNDRRIVNLHIHSKNTQRWRSDRLDARRLKLH